MNARHPTELLKQFEPSRLPPLERWNPAPSGTMDLCIARDGRWYHDGRPIERMPLVRLFATILRREPDGEHYLVTPVEKWRIFVDDAPFLAVSMTANGSGRERRLDVSTNLGEAVAVGPDHPLVVEYRAGSDEPAPYLSMRNGLRARLTRALFLELADLVEQGEHAGRPVYGVWSRDCFFALGPVAGA